MGAWGDVWKPIRKAFRAVVVLLGHLILVVSWFLLFVFFEQYISYLTGGHEILLFDRIPLKYLFHAIDVGILAVFGFWGLYEANEVWKKKS